MQDLNRILDKEAIMTLAAVRYVYVPSNEAFLELENKQHGSIYVVHQGDGTVIVYRVNRDGLPERVICRDYAAQVFPEDFPEPEEKIAGALGYCQRTGEMRVLQWDYGTGTGTWELIAWNSSVGDARPESPDPGRTWYDPVTESYLFYTGAEWKQLALGNIGEFLATRDETQALMDATQQLHDGALQASASANSAKDTAQQASASANSAKDTAQQASASANSAMQRALQSSSSAASYAEEALQHSTTAGQHKDTASAKAQEAAEGALAADASARASAESSEKALQYRDEAQALAAAATLAEEAATGALGMVATHLSATQDAAGQAAEDRALAESAKDDALSGKRRRGERRATGATGKGAVPGHIRGADRGEHLHGRARVQLRRYPGGHAGGHLLDGPERPRDAGPGNHSQMGEDQAAVQGGGLPRARGRRGGAGGQRGKGPVQGDPVHARLRLQRGLLLRTVHMHHGRSVEHHRHRAEVHHRRPYVGHHRDDDQDGHAAAVPRHGDRGGGGHPGEHHVPEAEVQAGSRELRRRARAGPGLPLRPYQAVQLDMDPPSAALPGGLQCGADAAVRRGGAGIRQDVGRGVRNRQEVLQDRGFRVRGAGGGHRLRARRKHPGVGRGRGLRRVHEEPCPAHEHWIQLLEGFQHAPVAQFQRDRLVQAAERVRREPGIDQAGFLTGFDQGLLDLVQPVYNITARNTESALIGGGGGGFDTTLDRMWLPSRKEVFG
jgi:hypothetical protein